MDITHSNAMAAALSTPKEISEVAERFTNYFYGSIGLAPKTVELNVSIMRRWARELGVSPTKEQMELYIATVRRGGKTNTYARAIAVNFQHFARMMGKEVVLGKPKKQKGYVINVLSEAEIAVMISRAKDERERAILLILAYTGIRNDELCGLRIQDLDLGRGEVRVLKAKDDEMRISCMAGPCVESVSKYLTVRKGNPGDLLFLTKRNGAQLATQDIRKIVRVVAKRAGITKRVHPHLFRHSLATNLLHRGAGLLSIQRQLGHRYLATTLAYLHTNTDRLQNDYRQYCPSYV